jgi:ATP-dependent helicase HrpA
VAEGRKGARDEDVRSERNDMTQSEQIIAALDEITREDPRGDALVFLPGEREIRDTHLALTRRNYRATEILPLYARLSFEEQERVFRTGGPRRIVLATNVAETSLTVPGIRYVIDTGTARQAPRSATSSSACTSSRSSGRRRAAQGRCGRVGPGICVRLYGEDDFNARPQWRSESCARRWPA